jgi:hypothetical protein
MDICGSVRQTTQKKIYGSAPYKIIRDAAVQTDETVSLLFIFQELGSELRIDTGCFSIIITT